MSSFSRVLSFPISLSLGCCAHLLPLTVVVVEQKNQRLSSFTEKNVKSLFGEIRSYRIEFLIISFAVIYYSPFRQRRSIQKAIIFSWNSLCTRDAGAFFFSCPVKIILLCVSALFKFNCDLFVSFTLFSSFADVSLSDFY